MKEKETESINEKPTRKQLAIDVDNASNALDEAYAKYNQAQLQVNELTKKYRNDMKELTNKYHQDVDAILEPAKKLVEKSEKDKYNAICKFNNAYGPYMKTYTGATARNEFLAALNELSNSFIRDFFDL